MKKNLIDSLITVSNIKVNFTVEQWKAYSSGLLSLEDVYRINRIDKEIGKLGKTSYNILLVLLASSIGVIKAYENTLTVVVNNPMEAIDVLGTTFLNVFKGVGYWITLIMAFIELIKSIMKGSSNTTEIFGIVFKYVLIYATMFLIPWFFDLIKMAF